MTTATDSATFLTPSERETFDAQGFLIRRGVVSPDVVQAVRDVFAAQVERLAQQWHSEGLITNTYDHLPFETRYAALRRDVPARFGTSWRRGLVSPAVYGLWRDPALLGPVRSLIGDEVFAHGTWNGRPREPGPSVQKVGWHQDAHYFRNRELSDGMIVSAWTPLVSATEQAGCLQFGPGSNHGGYVTPLRGEDNLYTVADDVLAKYTPFTAEMEPGDVVFFTDLTLHQALPNRSDYVRWSIDIRFAPATPKYLATSERGYYCFSAEDPSRVESYETWADKYGRPETVWYASAEMTGDPEVDAARLGVSVSELEVY